MDREDRRGQPGTSNGQATEHLPHEQHVDSMQEDVDDMVSNWVQAPQSMLDAECRIDQREVLRRRIQREPHAPKPIGVREELVLEQVNIVVPDKAAVDRRDVYHKHHQEDGEPGHQMRVSLYELDQ